MENLFGVCDWRTKIFRLPQYVRAADVVIIVIYSSSNGARQQQQQRQRQRVLPEVREQERGEHHDVVAVENARQALLQRIHIRNRRDFQQITGRVRSLTLNE